MRSASAFTFAREGLVKLNKDRIEGRRLRIQWITMTHEDDAKEPDMLAFTVQKRKLPIAPWQTVVDCQMTLMRTDIGVVNKRTMLMFLYKELLYCLEEGVDLSEMSEALSTRSPEDVFEDKVEQDIGQ